MNTSKWALFRFGFRQTLKGAIIVGLISGTQLLVQGVAYQKTYGTAPKQAELATSLANAPGLGFIYGDAHALQYSTQGYMVYRVLAFMGVVTAVWALMSTTKLLRGAEEDGRYEVIRAGTITPRRTVSLLAAGFAGAWWVGLIISYLLTLVAVKSGGIATTGTAMWLLNLAIFLPGLVFGGLGLFTSQLGLTRGRAMLYGIVPLVVLFLARGTANTSHSLHWLLNWTPFGWAQLVSPVYNSDRIWILLLAALAIVLGSLGVWFAERDYGESIIQASSTVRSRFFLLKNAWQVGLRQNFWVLLGWGLGVLLVIGLIAGLASTAEDALKAAGSLSKAVSKLGGGANDLKVAFMSAGVLFMVMILLIMSTSIVGAIRRDEAKQYLDNILVAPQKRTAWLMQRLLLGAGVVLLISLLGGLVIQTVATLEHTTLDFLKVLATSMCLVGSVAFLLGVGTLLYGFLPRLAVIGMYAVIIWSFAVTVLASAVNLNTILKHSTLFLYTNFNLTQWPDWETFMWFIVLAVVFSVTGIWAFAQRDIVPE